MPACGPRKQAGRPHGRTRAVAVGRASPLATEGLGAAARARAGGGADWAVGGTWAGLCSPLTAPPLQRSLNCNNTQGEEPHVFRTALGESTASLDSTLRSRGAPGAGGGGVGLWGQRGASFSPPSEPAGKAPVARGNAFPVLIQFLLARTFQNLCGRVAQAGGAWRHRVPVMCSLEQWC